MTRCDVSPEWKAREFKTSRIVGDSNLASIEITNKLSDERTRERLGKVRRRSSRRILVRKRGIYRDDLLRSNRTDRRTKRGDRFRYPNPLLLDCSLSVDSRRRSYYRDRVDAGLTSDWL